MVLVVSNIYANIPINPKQGSVMAGICMIHRLRRRKYHTYQNLLQAVFSNAHKNNTETTQNPLLQCYPSACFTTAICSEIILLLLVSMTFKVISEPTLKP